MNKESFEISLGDQKITLTTNYLAPQANAAILAQFGQTLVLATVVMGPIDTTKD